MLQPDIPIVSCQNLVEIEVRAHSTKKIEEESRKQIPKKVIIIFLVNRNRQTDTRTCEFIYYIHPHIHTYLDIAAKCSKIWSNVKWKFCHILRSNFLSPFIQKRIYRSKQMESVKYQWKPREERESFVKSPAASCLKTKKHLYSYSLDRKSSFYVHISNAWTASDD